jgi:hypothetical protein
MALRLQRRAAFGWPASAAGTANPTLGMAVHYEGSDTGIANFSHDRCIDHWQDTRRFHMNTRGWLDIGYSFGVCPHYVLEGRGKDKAQAAQPGGNTTWYSCTFMTGPGEQPHPGQVANFRALRAWLMADDVAASIRPHSSFIATGCPGDVLRAMISDGSLTRAPVEDDMPTLDEIRGVIEDVLSDPDSPAVKVLATQTKNRVMESFAHETSEQAKAARQQIAKEGNRRDFANLNLEGHDVEVVNLLTGVFRAVQHAHGAHMAVGEVLAFLQAHFPDTPEPTPEPM